MTPKQINLAASKMLLWMADFHEERGRNPTGGEMDTEFFRIYPDADDDDAVGVCLAMSEAYLSVYHPNGQSKRSH